MLATRAHARAKSLARWHAQEQTAGEDRILLPRAARALGAFAEQASALPTRARAAYATLVLSVAEAEAMAALGGEHTGIGVNPELGIGRQLAWGLAEGSKGAALVVEAVRLLFSICSRLRTLHLCWNFLHQLIAQPTHCIHPASFFLCCVDGTESIH